MLEIERAGWFKPRYLLRADGHHGMWTRRRFKEEMTGEIDGQPYELRRIDRRQLVLTDAGRELARAGAAKRGRWTISAGNSTYELQRRSHWRSDMDFLQGTARVGSIRKTRPPCGRIVCELPSELSPAAQAFVGFMALTLWNRAAASSGATSVAVTGSGS